MKDWCGENETRLVLGENPEELAELERGGESDTDPKEGLEQMMELIAGMPDELLKSDPALLRQQEGFSMEEIAQTLDAPVGTVKSRIYRAKSTLRTILQEN